MKLFATSDSKQTTRLKRLSMALALYGVCILMGGVVIHTNLVSIDGIAFAWLSFGMAIVQGGLYWAIRSGYSTRFEDPSLTLFQMMFGVVIVTYILSIVMPESRGAVLNGYVLILLFGIFQLNRAQYLLAALGCIASYAGLILFQAMDPPDNFNLKVETFQWIVISVICLSFTSIGSYIRSVREGLKESRAGLVSSHKEITRQRDELQSAHKELQSALRQLGELAVRDDLTGLFNRRQFSETLNTQIAVAQTTGAPFGILLVDIDHFKAVNDTYGHLSGDDILRSFSHIAMKCLRKTDFIARFGGEEFVILLPNTEKVDLLECAERVRCYIRSLSFDNICDGLRISVSLGASHYLAGESSEELLGRVDEALYIAKDKGRDQVVYQA